MPHKKTPLSIAEYSRMAIELECMSESIRARPEMDHDFANRLRRLASEMREDCTRAHPANADQAL